MSSQFGVGFDIPQNRPPVPPSFHQIAERYENQQTMTLLRKAPLASAASGHILSYFYY
jgi:hypothetical protein